MEPQQHFGKKREVDRGNIPVPVMLAPLHRPAAREEGGEWRISD